MSVVVLKAGNSSIIAKIARHEWGEVTIPRVLRKLTETEYSKIIGWKSISDPLKDCIRGRHERS